MQLQDKIAVITGGASGLGLATARVLLARGVRVADPRVPPLNCAWLDQVVARE